MHTNLLSGAVEPLTCLVVGALTRGDPASVGDTGAADAYWLFISEGQTTTKAIWQKLA